jgi:hypothetical protein
MSLLGLWQLAHFFTNKADPSGRGEFGFREQPCRPTVTNPKNMNAIQRKRTDVSPWTPLDAAVPGSVPGKAQALSLEAFRSIFH